MITTAELRAYIDDNEEARRLLNRMVYFCENWQGKLIDYLPGGSIYDRERRKGLVLGHDGPRWSEHNDRWVVGSWDTMGSRAFGGWGSVIIQNSRGLYHHIDPGLVTDVKEISRYPNIDDFLSMTNAYNYEAAVDMFCIYDCDAKGLRDWDPEWSDGPEYEVFCPIHSAAAYEEARRCYEDHGIDGMDEAQERRYFELTKIAYERSKPAWAA